MAGQGLSTDEVQGIREALAAGRKPRVVFTEAAGQMAGQLGQVVELTDPAASEEFVVVRFGRDELPGHLPEAKPEPEQPPAAPEPEFVLDTPRVPAPRREEPKAEQPQAEPKPAKRVVKAAKPKTPPGLTVTLAYAEGEWTVAAQQGTKALARPYVVKPAEALRMVALVDVPGVQEAVEQILAAERAEAEQQAEKLRAELAEIEARLAELREAR
ncbi:hypothetical protein [Micromonospora aurantiaca (nom. illeg.)]|uniref:hypothetical protein n=1 Tax=Micromonospora aurantiaca (nom. illeg.) TaxID=47850 RepID=UPI001656EFE0|nr:hypothetical protein [Micromonospora aurantiaca]MBC9006001.1 hypothetical protein [Micromonospora aurantiaca]